MRGGKGRVSPVGDGKGRRERHMTRTATMLLSALTVPDTSMNLQAGTLQAPSCTMTGCLSCGKGQRGVGVEE